MDEIIEEVSDSDSDTSTLGAANSEGKIGGYKSWWNIGGES